MSAQRQPPALCIFLHVLSYCPACYLPTLSLSLAIPFPRSPYLAYPPSHHRQHHRLPCCFLAAIASSASLVLISCSP